MSTTRAATKLEEQMALMLTKMEEQSQQLQNLAQQQAERLDGVAARQRETDEQVATLQDDLRGVKTLVHERLMVAEEKLQELEGAHAELMGRQKRLKEEIRSELTEVAATSGRTLSPDAPPFVPSKDRSGVHVIEAGDTDEVATSATAAVQHRPVPYDGKSAWDVYKTQFEMLAAMNSWDDAKKATHLAISLRGPAATVLANLPPEDRHDYQKLNKALESRFGSAHQTELNRMRLRTRTRRREESLPELSEDVERLTRLAYPDAAESMVDVLARDQLIDAMPDEEMRLRIRQGRPQTLRGALELALELESYQLAGRQRAKVVREVHLDRGASSGYRQQTQASTQSLGRGEMSGDDVLQQLLDALQRCTRNRSGSRRRPSLRKEPAAGPADRGAVTCWNCREKGHFRRDCKQRQRQERDGPSPQDGTATGSQPPGNGR